MTSVAVDSWAFIEVALGGERAAHVARALAAAGSPFTTREVVVEAFGFIHRASDANLAWRWWHALRAGRVRVIDIPYESLAEHLEAVARKGGLSLADHSLALAALAEGATDVLTADRGFRRLGLNPLLAA